MFQPPTKNIFEIEFGYDGKTFNAVCVTKKNGLRYYTIETLAKLPTVNPFFVQPANVEQRKHFTFLSSFIHTYRVLANMIARKKELENFFGRFGVRRFLEASD